MTKSVLVTHKKNYSVVTINRPEAHNALSLEVIENLHSAFISPKQHVILLRGAGDKAFCAGADLKYLAKASSAEERHRFFRSLASCLDAILSCPAIVVARATGNVLAGGMGLLAACDLAYAIPSSSFSLPEVHKGLVPMVVLKPLSKLIPQRVLNDLVLTARSVDAEEALRIGLVNQVVDSDQLDGVIARKLSELSKIPAQTLCSAKESLRVVDEFPQRSILPFFADRSALISVIKKRSTI